MISEQIKVKSNAIAQATGYALPTVRTYASKAAARLGRVPELRAHFYDDVLPPGVLGADICLASIIVVMRVFDITVPAIPTVERIMARCEALDAFAKADPRRQAGAPPT